MPAKNIGKTLKELRLKSGLTQKQAYEHIGVAQSTFSSWEVGKAEPPNDVFMKLCDLYNVKNILQTFGYDGYNEDGSLQLRSIPQMAKLWLIRYWIGSMLLRRS